MPLIVSHYTENTSYEQEVKNLYKSLKKYPDLEHWIEPIEHRGSWRANSNYCSVEKLRRHRRAERHGKDVRRELI